jgi:hypothetical protein
MLSKLALLFLAGMVLLAIVSGRPKPGDLGWRDRFRLSRLRRRPGDDDPGGRPRR